MLKVTLLTFFTYLCALFPAQSYASTIGKVSFLHGKAYLLKGKEEKKVQVGEKIHEGQTIATGDKSIAKVKLSDGSLLTYGPNTSFKFHNFKVNKEGREASFQVIVGKIRAEVAKLGKGKKNEVEFKTKTVSLGIRGTTFLMNLNQKNNNGMISVALLEGKIDLMDKLHGDKKSLKPGDVYRIAIDFKTKRKKRHMLGLGQQKVQAYANAGGPQKMQLRPYGQGGDVALGSSSEGPSFEEMQKGLFLEEESPERYLED